MRDHELKLPAATPGRPWAGGAATPGLPGTAERAAPSRCRLVVGATALPLRALRVTGSRPVSESAYHLRAALLIFSQHAGEGLGLAPGLVPHFRFHRGTVPTGSCVVP